MLYSHIFSPSPLFPFFFLMLSLSFFALSSSASISAYSLLNPSSPSECRAATLWMYRWAGTEVLPSLLLLSHSGMALTIPLEEEEAREGAGVLEGLWPSSRK